MPVANIARSTLGRQSNFAHPIAGGHLVVWSESVVYTEVTAKLLFTLPKGAIIEMLAVDVKTAFNAGDSNVLDIGVAADGAEIKNDLAVGSVGQTLTGWLSTYLDTELTQDTPIYVKYVPAGTAASTGLLYVKVAWRTN